MTLAEFLVARIAEDEHHAKQAWAGGYRGSRWLSEPDRQLAECEAKRQILLAHMPTPTTLDAKSDEFGSELVDVEPDSFDEIVGREVNCMTCAGYPAAPCGTLKALALPYSEHSEYREEWAL